jgi:hypothetical protein
MLLAAGNTDLVMEANKAEHIYIYIYMPWVMAIIAFFPYHKKIALLGHLPTK